MLTLRQNFQLIFSCIVVLCQLQLLGDGQSTVIGFQTRGGQTKQDLHFRFLADGTDVVIDRCCSALFHQCQTFRFVTDNLHHVNIVIIIMICSMGIDIRRFHHNGILLRVHIPGNHRQIVTTADCTEGFDHFTGRIHPSKFDHSGYILRNIEDIGPFVCPFNLCVKLTSVLSIDCQLIHFITVSIGNGMRICPKRLAFPFVLITQILQIQTITDRQIFSVLFPGQEAVVAVFIRQYNGSHEITGIGQSHDRRKNRMIIKNYEIQTRIQFKFVQIQLCVPAVDPNAFILILAVRMTDGIFSCCSRGNTPGFHLRIVTHRHTVQNPLRVGICHLLLPEIDLKGHGISQVHIDAVVILHLIIVYNLQRQVAEDHSRTTRSTRFIHKNIQSEGLTIRSRIADGILAGLQSFDFPHIRIIHGCYHQRCGVIHQRRISGKLCTIVINIPHLALTGVQTDATVKLKLAIVIGTKIQTPRNSASGYHQIHSTNMFPVQITFDQIVSGCPECKIIAAGTKVHLFHSHIGGFIAVTVRNRNGGIVIQRYTFLICSVIKLIGSCHSCSFRQTGDQIRTYTNRKGLGDGLLFDIVLNTQTLRAARHLISTGNNTFFITAFCGMLRVMITQICFRCLRLLRNRRFRDYCFRWFLCSFLALRASSFQIGTHLCIFRITAGICVLHMMRTQPAFLHSKAHCREITQQHGTT